MSGTKPPASSAAPPALTIDRLALEIPGFDPALTSRLTQLVASHLAQGNAPAGDIAIPRLAVTLAPTETSIEQIACAIARAIRSARGAGGAAARQTERVT